MDNATSIIMNFEVKKVDETNINNIIDSISQEQFDALMLKRLPKPNKQRIKIRSTKCSKTVLNVIESLHLHDESSYEKRIQTFIEFCKLRNLASSSVRLYFQQAKRTGIFGDTTLVPDLYKFEGQPHIRIVTYEKFDMLIAHLHTNWSKYTAPLLIPYYTVLRNSEILQFSTYTLYQLRERHTHITSVIRKQTITKIDKNKESNYWIPNYHSKFIIFIDHLLELYNEEIQTFLKYQINSRIFNMSASTLIYRLNVEYKKAVGEALPLGFGIHGYKTMMASKMSNLTSNIQDIQHFQQHKSSKTTQRYIQTHWNAIQSEFDKLTTEYSTVSSH